MWQNGIHQQRGTVGHAPCSTTGTKAASFAGKSHQLLIMAGLTANSQEAVLKPAALQILRNPLAQTNTSSIRLWSCRARWAGKDWEED